MKLSTLIVLCLAGLALADTPPPGIVALRVGPVPVSSSSPLPVYVPGGIAIALPSPLPVAVVSPIPSQTVTVVPGPSPIPVIEVSPQPYPTPSPTITTVVQNFPAVQPVSAASLPLPSGASTSALQTSTITALGFPFQAGGSIGNASFGISGTLPSFATTPTFNLGTLNGAATNAELVTINTTLGSPMQNSGGSVIANLGTLNGAATAANQTTANTSLATIATNTTGASTSANQTTANTSLASILSAQTNGAQVASLGTINGKTLISMSGSLSTTATTSNQVILTYTVPSGHNLFISEFDCSVILNSAAATQEQFGTCSLQIAGATAWSQYYKGPGSAYIGSVPLGEPVFATSGQVVQLVTTPAAVTGFLWTANLMGYYR